MMPLNIAVIGQTGQLARALTSRARTTPHKLTCYGRDALDLTCEPDQVTQFINSINNVDVIINAAAYTAVDKAEDDAIMAFKVNAETPGTFAKICAEKNIPFIHISTDYVFNGQSSAPYKPNEPTDPLGVYGASKLAGEEAILESAGRASILRTSWVYDGTGQNFFTTMLRLAQDRSELNVVSDQFGRPTYAGHLADAALRTAEVLQAGGADASGVFHVSNSGKNIHWADFASSIFAVSRAYITHDINVNGITSAQYPTRAKRPAYSVLDITRFEKTFQMKLPDWREGLKEAVAEWVEHQSLGD